LRSEDDIKRVEIEIDDEGLNIKKMNIFINPAALLLQKEITNLRVDIHTQKTSDYLSISIKDKMIYLIFNVRQKTFILPYNP